MLKYKIKSLGLTNLIKKFLSASTLILNVNFISKCKCCSWRARR